MSHITQTTPPCFHCGYDLRGLNGACPECGRPVYRFTDRAREVVGRSNLHAISLYSHRVPGIRAAWWTWLVPIPRTALRPRHVLAALARGPQGLGFHALLSCGIDPEQLARCVDQAGARPVAMAFNGDQRLNGDLAFRRMVTDAVEASFGLGHTWVGTEHLLLALIESPDRVARNELAKAGITTERVHEFLRRNAERLGSPDPNPPTATPASPSA